jgi:hypothetical protein
VEEVLDPFGRKLVGRLPLKQETLVCEDGKPLSFRHGEMSRLDMREQVIIADVIWSDACGY